MFTGRLMATLIATSGLVLAQPSLTTIQDTIYKADGSRFNGTAVINWSSFEASDTSNVGMQSLSVPIVNGALYVQLVPNINVQPTSYYTVHYNSDGLEQFTESWLVPASSTPLRVRDVKVDPNASTGTGGSTGPSSIAETQVSGLPEDLLLRPVKGAGYSPGRSAWVNDAGEIESVAGNPTDCVRVNGTAATCFDSAALASFIDSEAPVGSLDGVNSTFTLATAPLPSTSLQLYRNGVYQTAGIDFVVSSTVVQFLSSSIPQPGDSLLASYRVGGLHATPTQQLSTTFPLTGGGPIDNSPRLSLVDAAFLRRGHRAMVVGDSFAGAGASWAIPSNWFAQAAVESRSAIRYLGNAGLAGDTVANLSARLAADVVARHPDKVFLATGTADIAAGTQPATIATGIGNVVAALKAANILPVLCGIPPVPQFVAATSQYNLQLQKLADNQGLPFIDLSTALVDPQTGLIRASSGTDLANLPGSVNRTLATTIIAATAPLFDATPPWGPSADTDGVNLVTDPLFVRSPSAWTSTIVSGGVSIGPSFGPDSTIAGNIAVLIKTDRTSVNSFKARAITSGFLPGDRIAFTGRVKTSSVEFGGLTFDVGLQFSPGINVFYPIYHWQVDVRDGQWYVETVVPDGVTSIVPFVQLNQGTGNVGVGQIGLINLTALGL